jgi:hypothetical protein
VKNKKMDEISDRIGRETEKKKKTEKNKIMDEISDRIGNETEKREKKQRKIK